MGTEKTLTDKHFLLKYNGMVIPFNREEKYISAEYDILKKQTGYRIEMFCDSDTGPTPEWAKFDIPFELLDVAIHLMENNKLIPMKSVDSRIYSKLEKEVKKSSDTSTVLDQLGAERFGVVNGVMFYLNGDSDQVDIQYMDGPQRKSLLLGLVAIKQIRTI